MWSLLGGVVGGAIAVGCSRAFKKYNYSNVRPAMVSAVKGGMTLKKCLREEIKSIIEEVKDDGQKEGVEKVSKKMEEKPVEKKPETVVRERLEQLKVEIKPFREELNSIVKEAKKAHEKEKEKKKARPDNIDETLKEVDKHLKMIDKKLEAEGYAK